MRQGDNFLDGKVTDIAVDVYHTVPQPQRTVAFTLLFGAAPDKSRSSSVRVLVSLAAVPAGVFVPSPLLRRAGEWGDLVSLPRVGEGGVRTGWEGDKKSQS